MLLPMEADFWGTKYNSHCTGMNGPGLNMLVNVHLSEFLFNIYFIAILKKSCTRITIMSNGCNDLSMLLIIVLVYMYIFENSFINRQTFINGKRLEYIRWL